MFVMAVIGYLVLGIIILAVVGYLFYLLRTVIVVATLWFQITINGKSQLREPLIIIICWCGWFHSFGRFLFFKHFSVISRRGYWMSMTMSNIWNLMGNNRLNFFWTAIWSRNRWEINFTRLLPKRLDMLKGKA